MLNLLDGNNMDYSEYLKQTRTIVVRESVDTEKIIIEENALFESWINKFEESKRNEIRERMQYIRRYELKYPDYDGEEWGPNQNYSMYFENRDKLMSVSGFSEKDFDDMPEFKKLIGELGLSVNGVFEFIAYIWSELRRWHREGYTEFIHEKVDKVLRRIDEYPDDQVSLTVKVGKRNFTFTDADFIKSMLVYYNISKLDTRLGHEEVRKKKGEVDHIFIRTLLDELPIKDETKRKGARFSQRERNFCLFALWLVGEHRPETENRYDIACGADYNGVFDRLINEYDGMELPQIYW